MNTRSMLLELLEKNRGASVSGEEAAGLLGVSRAAVWKAVKSLEKDGYEIIAATNRGYSLSPECDILSREGIAPYLTDSSFVNNIHVFKTLESTNKTAKEMALNCSDPLIVIADGQTGGRGRRGREFSSASGSGLYISFLLHTQDLNLPSITMVTAIVAVAVCRAIKAITGREPGIKWVNDVLIGDKKVCGILTEGITGLESGEIDWVVAGIGINTKADGIPNELRNIADAVGTDGESGGIRNRLAAELINQLMPDGIWKDIEGAQKEYKSRLVMLGEKITVIAQDKTFDVTALDIDETCRLIVQLADGSVETLSSGEVSIRRNGTM